MRYRFIMDMPRNVSRKEYERYQLFFLGTAITGFFTLGILFMVLTNQTARPTKQLAQIESLSIADATANSDVEIAKLEGFLVTDEPLAMPDDEAQRVLRGEIRLSARSGSESDEETVRETLYEWEEAADAVYLTDGDTRLPLAFELAVLPLPEATAEPTPQVQRTDESSRFSRPVAVTYAEMTFPLSPALWEDADNAFVDLERRALLHGQSAVVVAGVETTETGARLVDPLGNRLQVHLGTEEEIRERGVQTRRLFSILVIPLGLAFVVLGRHTYKMRQDFVERSNQ